MGYQQDDERWRENVLPPDPSIQKGKENMYTLLFGGVLSSSSATYTQPLGWKGVICHSWPQRHIIPGFLAHFASHSLHWNLTTVPLKDIRPSWWMKPCCTSLIHTPAWWKRPPGWNVHSMKAKGFTYCTVCHFVLNEHVCIPRGMVRWDVFIFGYMNTRKVFKAKEKSWIVWAYFSVLHFMNIVMMYKSVSN